jgi:1,4-alpha-glucan branching enzyme
MLYLDYSRQPGEWVPNRHGGNENLEAIDFLRDVNEPGRQRARRVTIAEESTAWPGVSRRSRRAGLGFGFKWNMGWMHDTLPTWRRTRSIAGITTRTDDLRLLYAFSENFVLPLSHDEVVHGKGSLIGKMPGDRWQKFANLRAYYGFMWTHPGKKLLFMGCEFAQEREWNHDPLLDWHLLDDSRTRAACSGWCAISTALYRDAPALHERDCDAAGFHWIDGGDAREAACSVFLRNAGDGTPPCPS